MTHFNSLGLSKQLVATLSHLGFETPTPIQEKAIPLLLQGRDLIGLAQTGTGKTAAFGLPMIEMLLASGERPQHRSVRSLILAPTRELVNQIATNLKSFLRKSPLKITTVVGGVSINKQQVALSSGADILVATPGRLLDLLNRRALVLSNVTHLVLDEADQMLDLGFIHDLRKIAKLVPAKRQTMLFSATMPKTIADLAADYLTDPLKVEVTPPGKAADKIEQYVHHVGGKGDKTDLLRASLEENPDGRAIVFLRTKHGAEKLMKHLEHLGFAAASIHGNKSQGQRERALKAFKDGGVRVLVATDVAARGIDIPAVSHVYNYDLPEVPDAYVHRIGRTARAGREGIAIAFCAPDEARLLRDIERLMGITITVASGEAPASYHQGGGGSRNAPSRSRSGQRNSQPRRDGRSGGERRPANAGGRRDFAATGPDNDLAQTSDFKTDKPKRFGNSSGNPGQKHRGPRHTPGRPAGRHGEDHAQQGAGERRDGQEGRGQRSSAPARRRENA